MQIPPDLVRVVREAESLVVLTGAGMSAESGIPTFRDALEGLWSRYDPAQLATPEAFERDPQTVTRWYDERRMQCLAARPHTGHRALVKLEQHLRKAGRGFTLLTQNVDGLHQAAGSTGVIELHGTVCDWRCTRCGRAEEYLGGRFDAYPPICTCGGLLRPAVVWFGEELPSGAMGQAHAALRACEVFFSVGTSSVVFPVAGFVELASSAGARTVEVNRDPTSISPFVDWSLWGPAGEVLPRLVGAIAPPR